MASPFDPWRNTYGMPGPQDPNRPGEIRASAAPRWEEILRGSDVSAINRNPLVQALGKFLNKPSSGISETTRLSPIDYTPRPPEPSAMDKLPPTVQEGIGGLGLLANFLAPGVKLPPLAPKPTGIRAYHGSPHDFDKFDMSKIGTGEGAQAYGHGLYFAESEGVAKAYRDQLADYSKAVKWKGAQPPTEVQQQIINQLGGPDQSGAMTIQKLRREYQRNKYDAEEGMFRDPARAAEYQTKLDELARIEPMLEMQQPGRMYEVNIKADPDQFLDWDKPINQQSEAVRRALEQIGAPMGRTANQEVRIFPTEQEAKQIAGPSAIVERDVDGRGYVARNANGYVVVDGSGDFVPHYGRHVGPGYEQQLREAGIPGIRYKDAMSRGADGGSSNYVVFNDALIEILRKYGLIPPAIAAGAALSEQEPPL